MSEIRKLAAILVVDYHLLPADRILERLSALRSELIDPIIAAHHGSLDNPSDGSVVEFRSVVDAVRCAIEVQDAMIDFDARPPGDRGIVIRIGIHLGDLAEKRDGRLGDALKIALRLENIATPGGICLSEDAYRLVKRRLDLDAVQFGPMPIMDIPKTMRLYLLQVGCPRWHGAVCRGEAECSARNGHRQRLSPPCAVFKSRRGLRNVEPH